MVLVWWLQVSDREQKVENKLENFEIRKVSVVNDVLVGLTLERCHSKCLQPLNVILEDTDHFAGHV